MKPRFRGLTLFVTVGSTQFDELISSVLEESFLSHLSQLKFSKLIIQLGNSKHCYEEIHKSHSLGIEIYAFKDSIEDDILKSDIVLSHAGAGTCLEVLRSGKRLLIVVNESLMDNHQRELADQLTEDNYAFQTTVCNLAEGLQSCLEGEAREFPVCDPARFRKIFEESLKKINSR